MFSISEFISVKISPIHCVWTEISAKYIFVVFDCPRLYAELTASRQSQMVISFTFGKILFNTDQDTKAWKYIEISLINASYIGARYEVAKALEYMGYGYLRRGDYQNAYGAYEAAAGNEKYLGTLGTHVAKACKNNMAKIGRKQGNPEAVIAFNRPSTDTDETLFYPPVQAF